MKAGILVLAHIGRTRRPTGTIEVRRPDFAGDMLLSLKLDSDSDDHSIYMRREDARELAMALLELSQEE